MRDAVAWLLRRARTWAALVAAVLATALASADGRAGWTVTVGLATFCLALLSMRAHWLDEHPDRPTREDRAKARHDAMVAAAVRRYQGVPEPEPAAAPVARGPVRWAVRRARTWLALAAAFGATVLAHGYGGTVWTLVAAPVGTALAALSIGLHYVAANPDRPPREEREKAKYDAWVERTLGEYRAKVADGSSAERRRLRVVEVAPESLLRRDRAIAESVRRYEREADERRAALKPPSAPE